MKCVILAGGYGTRITEESYLKPKPMIEIGGKPILWHIMKLYSSHNINDFIICCGYRGNVIKEYFEKYDFNSWNVKMIDTGQNTTLCPLMSSTTLLPSEKQNFLSESIKG